MKDRAALARFDGARVSELESERPVLKGGDHLARQSGPGGALAAGSRRPSLTVCYLRP